MRKAKIGTILLTVLLICWIVPLTALADTEISSVSLRISSDIVADDDNDDVEVTTSSSRYEVDEVKVTNAPSGDWDEGDEPKVRVTLLANDGYYFASGFSEDDVSLSGDDAEVTNVSRSSKTKLRITIQLAELEGEDYDGDYELEVSGLEWDEDDGTAYWDETDDAKKYEVRLYRDGSSITSVKTTTRTYYDFSDEFTKSGDYTFRVRAVRNSSNKGSWEESYVLSVSSSEARSIRNSSSSSSRSSSSSSSSYWSGPGATVNSGPGAAVNSTGAWMWDSSVGRWWYSNADRTYTISNWQYIDGNWFYFDAQGYMVTGWQYINGNWYYFDSNGYMQTGWILYNGVWYYCDSSGAMLTNTRTPDGYYVGGDGAWLH